MKLLKKISLTTVAFFCLFVTNITAFAIEQERAFTDFGEAQVNNVSSDVKSENRRISLSVFNASFQTRSPALEPQKATGIGNAEFRHLNYLYHEWFHGFQRNKLFTPAADEPQVRFRQPMVPPDRIADPKFTETVEMERKILIAALRTPSKKELRQLLQQYLAVRFLRTESLPDVLAIERYFERYEGTATLVGLQAAAAATGAPEGQVSDWIQNELERKLDSFPSSPTPDSRLLRWRVYGTGAALGLSLDGLKVRWRKPIETGTDPLDKLLIKAVQFNPTQAGMLAKEANENFK